LTLALDYFEAVQLGRERVKDAISLLQSVAGPSYPVLFLKLGAETWTPVGEEKLYAVVPGKGENAAVVICDSEGNSKAMTPWFSESKAEEVSRALSGRGVRKFDAEVKLPI
jgi:hypothetical protein